MTDISRRLEKTLKAAIKNNPILPVKTDQGILVGDVLIVSEGSIKHIQQNGFMVYDHIYLNSVAIKIANLLAKKIGSIQADQLYKADQEYGKWFVDSQMMRARYQKAKDNRDFDKADVFWARYQESRDKAATAKNHAESLAVF